MRPWNKKILMVVAALVLASPAHAQDNLDERLEAAKEYIEVVPVRDVMGIMLDMMAANPNAKMSQDELAYIKSHYDYERTKGYMVQKVAKNFTVDEIRALIEMYKDPAGRSAMLKFPVYMQDVLPDLMQLIQNARTDYSMQKQEGTLPQTTQPAP